MEKSNTLWEQDAPEPQPSWLAKVIDMNNHPPIPGENGYWLIWDTDKGAYVESELPLPPVSGEGGKESDPTVPNWAKVNMNGTVGQFISVSAVDDSGNVTAVAPVTIPNAEEASF